MSSMDEYEFDNLAPLTMGGKALDGTNSWEEMTSELGSPYSRRYPAKFTAARWNAHKSTGRYWRHLNSIFSAKTTQSLARPLFVLTASSTAICWWESSSLVSFTMPAFVFSVLSVALSLLMVFRTDSSYSRWTEALDTWVETRFRSREMLLHASNWVDDPALREIMFRWTAAYWQSLALHLKGYSNPQPTDGAAQLEALLRPPELESLREAGGHPLHCVQVLMELVEVAFEQSPNDVREAKMLTDLAALNAYVATAHKLVDYPLPLSYTRHTSRFMLIFLFAMPLTLWNSLQWLSVPVTVVVAFLLLGVEEIGVQIEWLSVPVTVGVAFLLLSVEEIDVQIEEPYGLLPLGPMADDICRELRTLVSRARSVKLLVRDVLATSSLSGEEDEQAQGQGAGEPSGTVGSGAAEGEPGGKGNAPG
ncbi:hypothetical protein FOA52_001958 [Chlamydomonas sp. UWO 241]|nr:hypothetical protein FOA52_001958 [Chlamydomonas sp. UWO 241]